MRTFVIDTAQQVYDSWSVPPVVRAALETAQTTECPKHPFLSLPSFLRRGRCSGGFWSWAHAKTRQRCRAAPPTARNCPRPPKGCPRSPRFTEPYSWSGWLCLWIAASPILRCISPRGARAVRPCAQHGTSRFSNLCARVVSHRKKRKSSGRIHACSRCSFVLAPIFRTRATVLIIRTGAFGQPSCAFNSTRTRAV